MTLRGEGQAPLIAVRGVSKHFPTVNAAGQRSLVRAVHEVSFNVFAGETVGVVGESGSGKSTLGKLILALTPASAGSILFDGADLATLPERRLKPLRRDLQMVFQDPMASLNPRLTIGRSVGEGLTVHRIGAGAERREMVRAMLEKVGLSDAALDRYPHQFSGGQRQRISIARALMVNPRVLVADEPVSALDVSVQGQIVNLLTDLRKDLGLTLLFISHDLDIVRHISDRVVVMYLGRVVENGPAESLFTQPMHPYTRALLSASPRLDRAGRGERVVLTGEIPSPAAPPSGCVFRTRCPYALANCAVAVPTLREDGTGHAWACVRDDLPWRHSPPAAVFGADERGAAGV